MCSVLKLIIWVFSQAYVSKSKRPYNPLPGSQQGCVPNNNTFVTYSFYLSLTAKSKQRKKWAKFLHYQLTLSMLQLPYGGQETNRTFDLKKIITADLMSLL